ncbi:hypothetical protein KJZ63_00645 [Patescibacteria group bacterium]|nr:hypothetical protein [Patescibacteria group bacterium]
MKKALPHFTKFGDWFFQKLKIHYPLLIVLSIALIIAAKNIGFNQWYSGWDNLHGEFDLSRYTSQVLGGAWLEHQGLGAPMNLAHLAEVSRLPILWLLATVLPDHLIRITFIFLMYTIGGISMYFFLSQVWVDHRLGAAKNWVAALGGVLYLLHILTLQQFYIAFEMFTVQFAFLPLLFLIVHRFRKKVLAPTVVLFAGLQMLLAPSGHTPTNFYLAVLSSQVYGFFLLLPKGLMKALKTAFVIGLLTFVINSYWIVPNLYYTFHNAHYVQESHDNQLFAPESVSSIREAGTWQNFLKGTQYLLEWKDYDFETKQLELIFNDWQEHLNLPYVQVMLVGISLFTIFGLLTVIFNRRKGTKRWAIALIYVGCVSFIWMGLFPSGWLFEKLYQVGSFTEAFRNPFTKLSIIYSVVSVILFVSFWEVLLLKIKKHFRPAIVLLLMVAIGYTVWPSFEGHFISEKLKVQYPSQYFEMFAFLRKKDPQLRILPLPQLNHAGWEYFDWQFLGKGNGYQGMGFYFFGVPQPVLHRDSDRWVETSDFFFHELKYALDSQDLNLFNQVVEKYKIDLILIDETRVDPSRVVDFSTQHQLAKLAGFSKIWQLDFLSIYQKPTPNAESKLLIPPTINKVDTNANRVIFDAAFKEQKDYLLDKKDAGVSYPLAELLTKQVDNIVYADDHISLTKKLPDNFRGEVNLKIPDLMSSVVPVAVSYHQGELVVAFPKTELRFTDQIIELPHLENQNFVIPNAPASLLVLFDNQVVTVGEGQTSYQVLNIKDNNSLKLSFAVQPAVLPKTQDGFIDGSRLEINDLAEIGVSHKLWEEETKRVELNGSLTVVTTFPFKKLNITENPSQNCSKPERGSISTRQSLTDKSVLYTADSYGVNCNGLSLIDTSSWEDYLLRVVGENHEGRGLKFFINRSKTTLPDDYIFSTAQYDSAITLHGLFSLPETALSMNWEARSLGMKTVSSLNQMLLLPVPLQQLAGVSLSLDGGETKKNGVEVVSYLFGSDTFHVVELNCQHAPCAIGLDQSYDSAWLGFVMPDRWWKFGSYKLLSHWHLNSWANAWEVSVGKQKIMIFYGPQILTGIQLIGLGMVVGLVLRWAIKFYQTKFYALNKKLRRRLLGF